MKKVLITATTYPLHTQDTQPRFIHDLAKSMEGSVQVTVLVPRAPDAPGSEKIEGVHVLRYPYFFNRWETLTYGGGILENLKQKPAKFALVPFLLISQFIFLLLHTRKQQYDIIHAHWIIPQGLIAVLLKKITSRPFKIVVTSHGGDLYALQGHLLNRLKRWVLTHADASVVVSSAMKQFCHNKLGVPPEKAIHIRSMGVDLTNRFVITLEQGDRNGIIFVGRIAEKKGLHVLIRALSILKQRPLPITLTVVGAGPELERIQQLARDLEVDQQIDFMGPVPNQEIPALLNRHKLFVMPSIVARSGDQEGLGLAAIEAMGCGCAVIASDLEAVRDVVKHNKTGLMFTPENPEALADAAAQLLENQAHLEKLASAGRLSALQRFDWQQVANDYRQIYIHSH